MTVNTTAMLQEAHNPSTTNNLILDYLFYQSIQSRLHNAFSFEEEDCTSSDANSSHKVNYMSTINKKKNVIESVIDGILSSANKSNFSDKRVEQRLNLCQLTNLAVGRNHHVTFSAPVAARRCNYNGNTDSQQHQDNKRGIEADNRSTHSHNGSREEILFSKPFQPAYCRRHRRPNCRHWNCAQLQQQTNRTSLPGLAEAIPAFLKTSANKLRSVLENSTHTAPEHTKQDKTVRPLTVAGQQVMGGGMPPRWYDLFLDLLTQAAIQKYMCDGCTGLETIHEIFSYGYVEDEDEEDGTEYEDDEEDEDEFEEDDDEEEDDHDVWNVKAADHHLLFPKTRTMYLFKLQVHKREKEFTQVKEGDTLEQHFEELEKLYPFIYFERNMCDFIQMLLEDMDTPALDKCDLPDAASPIKSPEDLPEPMFTTTIPPLYKYPEDGSLLMPEIPDIIAEENDTTTNTTATISPSTSSIDFMDCSNDRKRPAYVAQLATFEDQRYQKHQKSQ